MIVIGGILVFLLCIFLLIVQRYYYKNKIRQFVKEANYKMNLILDPIDYEKRELEAVPYTEEEFQKLHFTILRMDEVLRAERGRLRADKRDLESLISDVAHQIKTPMGNLKLLAETLLLPDLEEEEKDKFLTSNRQQLLKLEFIIDALVKSSRLEVGLIQLDCNNIFVKDLMSEVITLVLPQLQRKQQEISLVCEESAEIYADKKWMRECIYNIVDNAAKYSFDGGKIEIEVIQTELYTRIQVRDYGIGVSEVDYGKLFQRFYRGNMSGEVEGIGIGLFLAREIVEYHGGSIGIKKCQVGSIFYLDLPVRFE